MTRRQHDLGFTLVEVLITCVLLTALLAVGAMPFLNWQRNRAQKDTVRAVVAELRNAQTRAMAESASYRVEIEPDGAQTFKVVGGTETQRSTLQVQNDRVRLSTPGFRHPSSGASGQSSVWFLPRGVASDGTLTVRLDGSAKVYTIEVEGLTSRVSYTD